MKFSFKEVIKKLPLPATQKWPDGVWDVDAYKHGTMSVILYCPHGKDYQTPHDQDELYFIVKGKGSLFVEKDEFIFEEGDALFVPAGAHHHFENCTKDIVVWAVFWGPKGGESE
jgi:mannose-6-phosphate isomerase-like protein (cupin superfamily)